MGQLSYAIKSLANLHTELNVAMTKQTLTLLCKHIEFLKIVRQLFRKHNAFVVETIQGVCQHYNYQTLKIIVSAKKRVVQDSSVYNERKLDVLGVLEMAEKCLQGPSTRQRVTVARLALSLADPNQLFAADVLARLARMLGRLEATMELQGTIDRIYDSAYLIDTILPIYMRQLMDGERDLGRLTVRIK